MKIFKYHINIPGSDIIEMPEGSEILYVGNQYNSVFLWAKVDSTRKLTKRKFIVCNTGDDLPANTKKFLGTVLLNEGSYVLHIFELNYYES